jgi:hypothetical protein
VHAGYGPRLDGAGAPCVTWVLDEHVVGDYISDWVSPTMGARSRQCLKAVQHGMLAGMRVVSTFTEFTGVAFR